MQLRIWKRMSLFNRSLDACLRNDDHLYTPTLAVSLPIGALSQLMIINWLTSERQPETGPRTDLNWRPIHCFACTSYPSYNGFVKKARLWQRKVNWTWNCWEVYSTKLREREKYVRPLRQQFINRRGEDEEEDEDIIIVPHCKVIQFIFHQLLVVVRQPMEIIIRSGEALVTFTSSAVLYYSMRAICGWRVERLT